MTLKNKERLETVRQDLIALFVTAAQHVGAALYALDAEDKRSLNEAFDDAQSPSDKGRAYIVAKDIADEYSGAYNLCRSENAMARDGKILADAVIAKWGQGQILKSMPELIDDPNPAIQHEIDLLLENVEAIMASHLDDLQDDQKMHHLIPGLDCPDIENKLMQLETAGDILQAVQEAGLRDIVAYCSKPAPRL